MLHVTFIEYKNFPFCECTGTTQDVGAYQKYQEKNKEMLHLTT
jgi:hypothetical protein